MKEAGLIDRWFEKHWRKNVGVPKKCKSGKHEESRVNISDVTGHFMWFGLGMVFASIIFVTEIAWTKFRFKTALNL